MSGPASGSRSSGETSLYAEWSTINATELCESNSKSVLYKLRTAINGQGVVDAVVRSLVVGLNVGTGLSSPVVDNDQSPLITSSISTSSTASAAANQQQQHHQHHQQQQQQSQPQSLDYLQSDRDVQWVMEVICYGLSLPIFTSEQHEGVRDCVKIYCEWMYCVLPSKSREKLIPTPIRDDPNVYFRLMMHHLYNVFIRRPQSLPSAPISSTPNTSFTSTSSNGKLPSSTTVDFNLSDVTSKQAVLCHRILRTLEAICSEDGNILDADSWETVLTFLLAINETLLAGPVDKDDIGTHLCERIVKSLFEIWVTACHRSFPSPSYWKTLLELCLKIRHRIPVIDYWSLTCLSITQRLVQMTSSSSENQSQGVSCNNSNSNNFPVLAQMSYEVASQTWYRFLHIIGNPVDLCTGSYCSSSSSSSASSSNIVNKTIANAFHSDSNSSISSSAGPGLGGGKVGGDLTFQGENFRRAIKGISSIVYTFLGALPSDITNVNSVSSSNLTSTPSASPSLVSPSVNRRSSSTTKTTDKSKHLPFLTTLAGRGPSSSNIQQQQQQHQQQQQSQLQNSPQQQSQSQQSGHNPSISLPVNIPSHFNQVHLFKLSPFRPKINSILNTLGNWLFGAALVGYNVTNCTTFDNDSIETVRESSRRSSFNPNYPSNSLSSLTNWSHASPLEIGQAEAIGTLCRLFSSKRTDEDISPTYLARFYLTLQYGLSFKEPTRPAILASILLNSVTLFQMDLNGVNILIPHFLRALEWVTNDQRTIGPMQNELRRASIAILVSLLPYPLHFNHLPIKDCLTETTSVTTFQSLRPHLTRVLISALRTESDSVNAQHLLIGLFTCIKSFVNFERENQITPNDSKISECNSSSNSSDGGNVSSREEGQFDTSSVAKEGIPDSSHGLFIRSLYLVCHNLISNWRNDTSFSLTALEILSGLARIRLPSLEGPLVLALDVECKKTVKWICEYIVNQCSRPPPFHSRDMHSTIVAAYQCLTVWFHEHPAILADQATVNMVFEVIELGISGSKSRTANGIVFKSQKQLKPASMRVREAAESLLSCLMNHIGFCPPPPCPPCSITGSMLQDELTLLKNYKLAPSVSTPEEAVKYYRYFVKDGSILLAILKESQSNRTVLIIRSAFGKYCWLLDNQLVTASQNVTCRTENIPRPLPAEQSVSKFRFSFKYFPDFIEKIPVAKLDMVVPPLESVVAPTSELRAEHEKLRRSLERQCMIEKQAQQKISIKSRPSECKEPLPVHMFEPVRLVLSHFGFFDEGSIVNSDSQNESAILPLDYTHVDLFSNLRALDMISTRTSDTVFVFYMRKGRSDPQEILNSVSSKHYVTQVFLDFLQSLGSVIDVKRHKGWTGNIESSWKIDDSSSTCSDFGDPGKDHGGCLYDGIRKAIYWADVSHELVFVVPSGRYSDEDTFSVSDEPKVRSNFEALSTGGRSMSSDEGTSVSSRNYSDTSSRSSLRNRTKQLSLSSNIGCDTKILVIWLESADDLTEFPIECLLNTTRTGVDADSAKEFFALFIHPLKNGLFRINTLSSPNRVPYSVPLVDGAVLDRGLLGPFVRMTALNYCRRRRLDSDGYQPAQVKRRLKIQEMANKFQLKLNHADFLASVFF